MRNRLAVVNATVLTPQLSIERAGVLIEDGKIAQIISTGAVPDCQTIDAKGAYLAPGFVDIHVHGGGGHDFMDGTPEAFLGVAKAHARHGTTTLLPTTLACSDAELEQVFQAFQAARECRDGANMPGVHLEGPYFSAEQAGAQDPRYIRNPEKDHYEGILSRWGGSILRWSAAPELPGALEFGRELTRRGILPSTAHTDAFFEQVEEAYRNGFTHLTHLYSGMSSVRRAGGIRRAGAVESAYVLDGMTAEIIADGLHLPTALLRMVYKNIGPKRAALVTDAMRAAGEDVRTSILGSLKNGQEVIVEDGVAKLPDRSALAGSVATMDRLVRTMVRQAGVPLPDAVRMATATPARIMNLKGKGALASGMDGDIVLFDENITVLLTVVGGRIVYGA